MSLYRILVVLLIISGLAGIFTYFQQAIANHPKIVEMEVNQRAIQKNQEAIWTELSEINRQLGQINLNLSRLLNENYP